MSNDKPPSPQELATFATVAAILDVEVEPWDVKKRQSAVDAILHLPGGRTGALEVTTITDQQAFQVETLLAASEFHWDHTDRLAWRWNITVGPTASVKKGRPAILDYLADCEAAGITAPHQVWSHQNQATLQRLGIETAYGDPHATSGRGQIDVLPKGGGGAVGNIDMVTDWLDELTAGAQVARKITKLNAARRDETHLLLFIDFVAAPFEVAYALNFHTGEVPTREPNVDVDALWIVTRYGAEVWLWRRGTGWSLHPVPSS